MAAPVRGTQSFVDVMGQVWRRPSLSAMEIAWRWLPGAACVVTVVTMLLRGVSGIWASPQLGLIYQTFQSMSVFRPAEPLHIMSGAIAEMLRSTPLASRWTVIGVFFGWNLLAAVGRTTVLRRLDPTLHARRISLFLLGTLRALLLAFFWLLEWRVLRSSVDFAVFAPAVRGDEAHLVSFSATIICGTLLLYVAWGIVSWPLQLAPLLAMRDNLGAWDALRAALGSSKQLRSKLIEINLVMNIVRIALMVLAMVMSASPLAFQTVATQQFFIAWWCLAIVLYLAASDYFHVVRSAAYLSLHRALKQVS